MKKSLILLASLAIGTTAIAQDMPAGAPMQGSPPMTNAPAPATPPTGTDSPPPPAASAPAPGDNGMAPPAAGAPAPAPTASPATTDTSSYPHCSRTVTDKCVQGGPGRRPHK